MSKHEFKVCARCHWTGKWTALDEFRCPVCYFTEPFEEAQSTQAHQPTSTPTPSILTEAEAIINGPRQDAYGDPATNFARIATGWNVITGVSVTPRQVALMMIWLKVCREANRPQRDNLVDIAGYAALAEKLLNVNPPTPQPL